MLIFFISKHLNYPSGLLGPGSLMLVWRMGKARRLANQCNESTQSPQNPSLHLGLVHE